MTEVLRPRSKERLAYVAKSKLEDLGQDTYDSSRQAEEKQLDSIYRKYGVGDDQAFDRQTKANIAGPCDTACTVTLLPCLAASLCCSGCGTSCARPDRYTSLCTSSRSVWH